MNIHTCAGPLSEPLGQTGDPEPCVFLDRDGAIIELVHYLSDPADVSVLPGAPKALRRLRDAGYRLVVVSNQSVVGRGMIDEERLGEINQAMKEQFAAHGVWFDGVYSCPVPPEGSDRTVIEHPDRKPGPGMLQRAARELNLDLPRSWMVGDMISDVLAGVNAGCAGSLLVETGAGLRPEEAAEWSGRVVSVPDMESAADYIVREAAEGRRGPETRKDAGPAEDKRS